MIVYKICGLPNGLFFVEKRGQIRLPVTEKQRREVNNQTFMEDINNEKGEQELITPTEEQNPASDENQNDSQTVNPQEETQTDDLSQSDDEFPDDQSKQRQAFYNMRKKMKDMESKLKSQEENKTDFENSEDDLDLLNLTRGNFTQDPAFRAPNQNNVEFDTEDPATQAFLQRATAAEQNALSTRSELQKLRAEMEDKEAWGKYPFLNPRNRADRTEEQKIFVSDLQAEYMAEKLRALQAGKPVPQLVDVANKVQAKIDRLRGTVREQATDEVNRSNQQKMNASLESGGTRTTIAPAGANDRKTELKKRINMGDIDALAELNKLEDPYIQGIE